MQADHLAVSHGHHQTCHCLGLISRLSPYGEFGSVADDKPNATNRYLTEQLDKFGLAYLHMVEPRIAGNTEVDVTDKTFNLSHFRKLYNGTFIAAGKLCGSRHPCCMLRLLLMYSACL